MPAPESYVSVALQVHWVSARPSQFIFQAESSAQIRLSYLVPEMRIVEELWDLGLSVETINEIIQSLVMGPRIWTLGIVPVREEFLAKFHSC